MHSVLFSLKRAFHKSTTLGRMLLDDVELTPSRFDILHVLHGARSSFVLQSDLRRLLGVASTTLSRMLRALEERGFITRSRDRRDGKPGETALACS